MFKMSLVNHWNSNWASISGTNCSVNIKFIFLTQQLIYVEAHLQRVNNLIYYHYYSLKNGILVWKGIAVAVELFLFPYAATRHWKCINSLNSGNNGNTSPALSDCCQALQKTFQVRVSCPYLCSRLRRVLHYPWLTPHHLSCLAGPSGTSMTPLQQGVPRALDHAIMCQR